MPKIQEYQQQTSAAGPEQQRAANIEDTGNVGNAVRNLGTTLESAATLIDRRAGQSDVSDLSAKFSKLRADQTNKLTQTLQSATPEQISGGTPQGAPGSKSISESFLEDFDKQMTDISNGAATRAGREFAQRNSEALREHFQVAAFHGQSQLAGAQAVGNYRSTVQNNATALMNDPSQFDSVMSTHDDLVKSLVQQGLPADKAPELKAFGEQQLANGAARGLMEIDPSLAKKNIEEGRYDKYITADDKYKLLTESDMYIKAQDTEAKRQEKVAKEARQEQIDKTQDQMLSKVYSGSLSTKDILQSPDLDYSAKKDLLHVLDQHARDKLKSDPEIYTSILERIHAPDGDPDKISDPSVLLRTPGLSLNDMNKLRREITKTPEGQIESQLKKTFMDSAKKQLTGSNPLLGIKDPTGDQNFQSFQADVLDEYNKQRTAGKSAQQLLSPTISGKDNPDYLGNKLKAYTKSTQQVMQEIASQARSSTAPSGKIMVEDEKGNRFYAPAENLEKLQAKKYKVVK